MPVRARFLAFLLLPLPAAGVGGLRWAHVAIAHGEGGAATEAACSHRHHACGHAHGQAKTTDSSRAFDDDGRSEGTQSSDDDCLDCDLLAVMVGGATHDGSAPIVATTSLDRVVDPRDVAAIRASDAHRARPPPVA